MIEKKYKNLKGQEGKNTFFQLDTYENQSLWSAKNRYVYDMSFKLLPSKSPSESRDVWYQNDPTLASYGYPFYNLSPEGYGTDRLSYGQPGGGAEFITDAYPSISNYAGFESWNDFDYSVTNEEGVFVFNQNTIGFTDAAASTYKKANYVDFFRSGYVEFSIKTNKQNCIVASGTSEIDADDLNAIFWIFGGSTENGTTTTELYRNNTAIADQVIGDDYPNYTAAQNFDGALVNLNIGLKNGKVFVEYYDDYNRDNVNFSFVGNQNVADGNWHHIVINFGRPGQIKTHGEKFNKKFVEIWTDAKLDKRFDEKVNDYQIFYPVVKWLFTNIKDAIINIKDDISIEDSVDYHPVDSDVDGQRPDLSPSFTIGNWANKIVGLDEILNGPYIFRLAVNNAKNKEMMFSGAIHTFAHGVNHSLDKYEIQKRCSLWNGSYRTSRKSSTMTVSAEMVDPQVTTNSKKVLKLYWDNLLDNGKFGLELDSTYQCETYSVVNKVLNSRTELFNFDKTIKKTVNILENVRIAFTDNVLVLGPGKILFSNTQEAKFGLAVGSHSASQLNPKNKTIWDSVGGTTLENRYGNTQYVGPRTDIAYSNIIPNNGDRVLLTGQIDTSQNGIWIWNGIDNALTRTNDSLINNDLVNMVYVTEGENAGTYWKLEKSFESIVDPQRWDMVNINDPQLMPVAPVIIGRWKNIHGEDRLINLQEDINLSIYDAIVFMNYPESNDDIFGHFPNENKLDVLNLYNAFIESLKIAASNGASLFVSSPKLAEDLGIAKSFEPIDQEVETSDGRSAVVNPFQFNEPAERYFDTHRQNMYHLSTPVTGLTDKETWVLTEFINYLPENTYDYEEYHAKYSYRQFGLQEGNEFLIPSLTLRASTDNDALPGNRENSRSTKPIYAVAPQNVLAGTTVTKFANTHYHGENIANNEYDDYVTTIVVHNGQLLGNYPINGKIFVNCVEDSLTMSREEYNKAVIQVVPENTVGETLSTRAWQYSTSRLNRAPKRVNVKDVTSYGQVIPTNGGGGPLIQAPTNSSNGIILAESVRGNKDYESDLYPTESEEIYETQEIPVLSMTWLGLQWLVE
jgi:hypothetical protein